MIKKTRIVGPWMLFSTCKQSKCGYRCTVLLMGSHYFSSQKVVIGQDKQQCLNIFLKCVNVHNFGIFYIVYKNVFFSQTGLADTSFLTTRGQQGVRFVFLRVNKKSSALDSFVFPTVQICQQHNFLITVQCCWNMTVNYAW